MVEVVDFLSRLRLFQHLNPEELGIVASRVRRVSLPDGPVMTEGSPPDGLYIIRSGVARVTKASDKGTAEAVLALLRADDSFGEISEAVVRSDEASQTWHMRAKGQKYGHATSGRGTLRCIDENTLEWTWNEYDALG
ncbi:MAG: cyclic nucleotide-binding domain-containing protein, partial [Chloroflexi bacterium]|nr:cyclic nucleotide-binding domain-containing protein [Chloroflexota bacterium]